MSTGSRNVRDKGVCVLDEADNNKIMEIGDGWVIHVYENGSGLRHKHDDVLYFDRMDPGSIPQCYKCGARQSEYQLGYLKVVRWSLGLPPFT